MLAFLLFAGAMHVNLSVLWLRAWPVIAMATIGTIISTFVVGVEFLDHCAYSASSDPLRVGPGFRCVDQPDGYGRSPLDFEADPSSADA